MPDFDVFVSGRPTATIPFGTGDFVPVVQGGATRKIPATALGVGVPATGLTATGTGQSDAFPITAKYNEFTIVPLGPGGAVLPVPVPGDFPTVVANVSSNALNVFPSSGVGIDQNGTNNPAVLAPGDTGMFFPVKANAWYSK